MRCGRQIAGALVGASVLAACGSDDEHGRAGALEGGTSASGGASGSGGVVGSGGRAASGGAVASGGATTVCVAGDTRRCVGPGACDGGQTCLASGAWSSCDCGAGSGGAPAAGGNSGVAGAGGNVGAGGTDASVGLVDAGPDGDANVDSDGGDASLDGSPTDAGPVIVSACPGPLSTDVVQQLRQGGTVDGERFSYPYEGTVFPRGLPAPVLQWDQVGLPSAVHLRVRSTFLDYEGCFGAQTSSSLALPAAAWAAANAQPAGLDREVRVELTVLASEGNVFGPVARTVSLAPGALEGRVFYSTYTSPQANNNGATMRLDVGATSPVALLTLPGISPFGPCWSCHSLSADGARLVSQRHQYPGGPYASSSFDLTANPTPNANSAPLLQSSAGALGMGAVYPDGTKVLTMGSPGDSSSNVLFPDGPGNVAAMIGPMDTALRSTTTGAVIALQGFTVRYAKMPSFSPDGSLLVFNWHEDSDGHSLGIASFDSATNTVSNVRRIYVHDTLYPGWPTITPDNQEVVFALGSAPDYVSSSPSRPAPASSDLWTVNIATLQARQLARANGYAISGGVTYLPRPGRDEHLQFFPSLSPIAAGARHWLFFTSRRTYGNQIIADSFDPVTKKVWVAALDIGSGGTPSEDPSHPPFYLPGQEIESGNFRPVFVSPAARP